MGRNQVRALGVAVSVVGLVLAAGACGSPASTAAPPVAAALPTAAPVTEEESAEPSETPTSTPKPTTVAAAPKRTAQMARSQKLATGTPCTVSAKACVDLDSQRAWLLDGKGNVVRGPVLVATGSKTEPTPPGYNWRVEWKNKDHVSSESFTNGVPDPMPYSVFFAPGGIAFHAGDPENPSGGCVHLPLEDAKFWFSYLKVGDLVEVVNASKEYAARGMTYDGPIYGAGGVRKWLKENGGDDGSSQESSSSSGSDDEDHDDDDDD